MNSTHKDLNWWLKWLATTILVVGTAINSAGIYPLGVWILNVGGFVWLVVAIRWKEPSLIVVNAVMTLTAFGGMAWHYFA